MPIQTAIDSISNSQGSPFGFKNRIINGGMVIDQRNAGASLNPADQAYSLDRWKCRRSQASKYTIQQNAGSVTPPVGFTNYLGVTSSSAYSVGASDYFAVQQLIEGYNLADLGWGTSNAKTVTLSFWVYSSLTGTFGGALNNGAEIRAYGFTYTINSANTWEQKTITIAGDTTGTWLTTNGIGLYVNFNLGTGSLYGIATNGSWTAGSTQFTPSGTVSVVGTNAATWYVTGVQLEVGKQATSFDYRPYGYELQLCQRYCPVWSSPAASYNFPFACQAYLTTAAAIIGAYPVQPRVAATGITTSGTFAAITAVYSPTSAGTLALYGAGTSLYSIGFLLTGVSGLVAGNATSLLAGSSVPAVIIATGCEL
jgi:hypothetical protein